MRYLNPFGLTLTALFVLGITMASAAQAFTLPDISLLAGESYPLTGHYHSATVRGKLSNPVEALESEGATASLMLDELSSTGTGSLAIEHVKTEKGTACNGVGDAAGVVLITEGEGGLVSFLEAGVLKLGLLLSIVKPLTVECGALKIKVKGLVLGKLNPNGESDQTEIGGVLTGNGAGKPTYTTYYNDNKEEVKAKLESNFGAGYKESAAEIGEEVKMQASEGKMAAVTGW